MNSKLEKITKMKAFIWLSAITIILAAVPPLHVSAGVKRKIDEPFGSGSGSKTNANEMIEDQIQKRKMEKELVKKLLAEHRERMKPVLAKLVKEQEKDNMLQLVQKKIDRCRAKHSDEKRKLALSIPELNEQAGVADDLWEGDIELSLAQAQQLLFGNWSAEYSNERLKRGAVKWNATKWPNGYVPYSFDASITEDMKKSIMWATIEWNTRTCLKLSLNETAPDRIQFKSDDEGCYSPIGMQGGIQGINLGSRCQSTGTVAHEIGHALGFWHEQSRYDRDEYVDFYAFNVKPEHLHNFKRQTFETDYNYGIPYDLGSVMHYGAYAFSKDGHQPTLVPKAGPEYLNTPGQRYGPSHKDYIVMNKHYCGLELYADGTSQQMVSCSTKFHCANGAFQNPNTCKDCVCPPGYRGVTCEFCNGYDVRATNDWQPLSGKVGQDEQYYDTNVYQHWLIQADAGKQIAIYVVDVGNNCANSCIHGNVEIGTAADRSATGVRLCCLSDLCALGFHVNAPNGYALISAYSYHGVQSFHILFRQY